MEGRKMHILGISGGVNREQQSTYSLPWLFHDGAAVLLRDGERIAAVEEERLNRLKHTTCFPRRAIEACLSEGGIELAEVDRIAYYFSEEFKNSFYHTVHVNFFPSLPAFAGIRTELNRALQEQAPGVDFANRIHFVNHHWCHALSAYRDSGMEECLLAVFDGMGDLVSASLFHASAERIAPLQVASEPDSIGFFYWSLITLLGYQSFDEYRVMGLAPYGDPARFRDAVRSWYQLLPEGRWTIDRTRAMTEGTRLFKPRRRGEPFLAEHKDFARAIQDAAEELLFHSLRHWAAATGLRKLALAGGVAHNCTATGKLARSGLFDDIFVHPASHDAGAALGAAIAVHEVISGARSCGRRITDVYWGPDIGSAEQITRELERWRALIDWERSDDIADLAAEKLSGGAVLGWVQGRSEFGPRALGHRSIVADPRPAQNKDRINRMIKKREAYRPFAPAVLRERAADYFVLPWEGAHLPFMNFVVPVREHAQPLLGAVTHVDGTARLQTVDAADSPLFARLLTRFEARSGVPILLNTSFNNNAEPIVDSVRDALVCFLTTELDGLVVGDCLIRRKQIPDDAFAAALAPRVAVYSAATEETPWSASSTLRLRNIHDAKLAWTLEPPTQRVLKAADGRASLEQLMGADLSAPDRALVLSDCRALWQLRLIELIPLPGDEVHRDDPVVHPS
jgi:carbamoyltransferase